MTPALRYAQAATLAALTFAAGAAWLATHQHWLFAAALTYTTALFTWIATREHAHHRRTIAEHHWARRHALGHNPPPLDPCCSLSRATHGTAHNHRCTDTTRWHTDDPEDHAA